MKNKRKEPHRAACSCLLLSGIFGYFGYSTMGAIKLGLDLAGGVSITYQAKRQIRLLRTWRIRFIKLQQRVQNYSTEAEVYQEGDNRINVDIPGVSDANAILQELGKPGSLVFLDSEFNQVLDGKQVSDAKAGMDDSSGVKEYVVALTFNEEGTKAFADATTKGVGKPIYIVYDGQPISAPKCKRTDYRRTVPYRRHGRFEEAENLRRHNPESAPFRWNWKSRVLTS